MSTAVVAPAPAAAQSPPLASRARGQCVACLRPYGRLRPLTRPAGLPAATTASAARAGDGPAELVLCETSHVVVCDQCWCLVHDPFAPDGADATTGVAPPLTAPALVFDPAVEALLTGVHTADVLHPLDRLLVQSGVRWAVLRHIAVPARMQLAGLVLASSPPPGTRSADSWRGWLAEVTARIRAQSGGRGSGAEFVYAGKRNRWWKVARAFARAADRDRRPLTWRAQQDIADEVGCEVSTVGRVAAWLQAEGLLWAIVPGCQLPRQHVPDDETPAEAAARRAAMLAAIAADEAGRARARAELAAVRAGRRGPDAAAAAQLLLDAEVTAALEFDQAVADLLDPPLVRLAPVYELRIPAQPDSPPDTTPPVSLALPHAMALTCTNPASPPLSNEFADPPQVFTKDQTSSSAQPVDKRRAPRGPYTANLGRKIVDEPPVSTYQCHCKGTRCRLPESTGTTADAPTAPRGARRADRPGTQQSEALCVAEWLLRRALDVKLVDGVSPRWLAMQLRASGLLRRAEWTRDDLVDFLEGRPDHLRLPYWVRNPRGWLRSRLRGPLPAQPPSRRHAVDRIQTDNDAARAHRDRTCQEVRDAAARDREQARLAAARAAAAARRAAIDACTLCDDEGWIRLHPNTPLILCRHTEGQSWND